MSTHIIDQIAAVKFPKERTGYYDDYYLLTMLSGDNNCFDQRGRRARNWRPVAVGYHYRCLAKAVSVSADVCGGMLRMAHGHTTPESLIKKFRTALDTAPDYDAPERGFSISEHAITFTAEEKAKDKYYFDRLVELKGPPEKRDNVYLRGDLEVFPFDFTQPRTAAQFIEHLPHDTVLWHHLRISGPGAI